MTSVPNKRPSENEADRPPEWLIAACRMVLEWGREAEERGRTAGVDAARTDDAVEDER